MISCQSYVLLWGTGTGSGEGTGADNGGVTGNDANGRGSADNSRGTRQWWR